MPGRLSSVDRSYVSKERIGGRSFDRRPTGRNKCITHSGFKDLEHYFLVVTVCVQDNCAGFALRIACSISVAQSYHLMKQLIT